MFVLGFHIKPLSEMHQHLLLHLHLGTGVYFILHYDFFLLLSFSFAIYKDVWTVFISVVMMSNKGDWNNATFLTLVSVYLNPEKSSVKEIVEYLWLK